MAVTPRPTPSVQRIVDAVVAKLTAEQDLIAKSEGEILISVYRHGPGVDIKLRITA
jgi:hypothetical protein